MNILYAFHSYNNKSIPWSIGKTVKLAMGFLSAASQHSSRDPRRQFLLQDGRSPAETEKTMLEPAVVLSLGRPQTGRRNYFLPLSGVVLSG